jgi:hypothetical protein
MASGLGIFENWFFFISLDAIEVEDEIFDFNHPNHIELTLTAFSEVYAGKKNNELDIIV